MELHSTDEALTTQGKNIPFYSLLRLNITDTTSKTSKTYSIVSCTIIMHRRDTQCNGGGGGGVKMMMIMTMIMMMM